MTTYTLAEFALRALRDTGLVGEDETPSAADQTDAEEASEAAIGTLNGLGIPIWNGSNSSIPHEYLLPLIDYVGPILMRRKGQIDYATSLQLRKAAEDDLRKLGMIQPTGATMEAEYF